MRRIIVFAAVMASMLCSLLILLSHPVYAIEPEKTGYWEFVDSWNNQSDSLTVEGYNYKEVISGSASGGFNDRATITGDGYRMSYTRMEDRFHNGTSCKGEYGEALFSFSPLPGGSLKAGEELSITANVSCGTSGHHVGVFGQVMIDYCTSSPDSNNYTYFRQKSDNSYVIVPAQVWQAEGKNSGGHADRIGDYTGTFSAVIPKGKDENSTLYIRFHFILKSVRIDTIYHYRWVDTTPSATETAASVIPTAKRQEEVIKEVTPRKTESVVTEEPAKIIQTVTQIAAIESGEDNGVGIISTIVLGIGGALAAAGALASSSGENGKDDQKKKTFKMKVYKNFGDGIRRGANPVTVWARIVEVEDGVENIRDDLTSKITSSGEGMNVKSLGMQNNYMSAEVSIPADSEAETAILIFTFTGAGGVMHNKITFRVIGEPEIVFPSSLSEDGKSWIMSDEKPLVVIAGAGGTARKLFVLQDAPEEPKNLILKAENGFEVTWEKREQYLTYDAVIKNNSAPMEKEAGIFGEQKSVYVRITAEFPNGTAIENGFNFGLWPQGFTVLYSRGLENDIKNSRPGQPAKLQNGRLDVRSYMEEGDKRGKIPYTAFDICYAVMKRDGTAQLYTEEKYFTIEDLRETDEVSKHVIAKYDSHITTFDGDFNNRICTISPQPMNPELAGSYNVDLPVRVTTPEKDETALIPLRLVGLEPGPPVEWTQEYKLLLDAVRRYYPEERIPQKIREIEENYSDHTLCGVGELRSLRRTVILWAMTYWQQQKDYAERDDATYWSRVWLLSEWGSRKLKWAGDIAFTLLICYKLGSNVEAILSPMKDFIAETVGEIIASCWGEGSTYDQLDLLYPDKRFTHISEIANPNSPAGKYARKFEEKLYSAFINLLTNLIDTDEMSVSFSISDKKAKTVFLKTGFVVTCFLLMEFFKNYYSMKEEERDYWKAFAKAFSNLSQLAIKKIFAVYLNKWMNSEDMQKFYKSKFMNTVNDKVKGVTRNNYTYRDTPLKVRYKGQIVEIKGQATGNVDIGRSEAHDLRLNLSDGRTAVIPNVKAVEGNAYLGYIEVISEILGNMFGSALEIEIGAIEKAAEEFAPGIINIAFDVSNVTPNAMPLNLKINMKKICEDPGSYAFDLMYKAVFGCLKLGNDLNLAYMNPVYLEIVKAWKTGERFWDILNNGFNVEQINWSFFDESDGYKK